MGNVERDRDGQSANDTPVSVFSLLGKAHTLDILYQIIIEYDQPIRFNELQDDLDVAPNTLSRRLEELVDQGLLVRNSYDEIPPHVEYEPTEKVLALEPTMREFGKWLTQYGDSEGFDIPDEFGR